MPYQTISNRKERRKKNSPHKLFRCNNERRRKKNNPKENRKRNEKSEK